MTEAGDEQRPPRAVVVAPDGTRTPFGVFLRERRKISTKSVTALVKEAGISRANYYLLEKGTQRPNLATAISLLRALELETAVPREDDPDLSKDLDINIDGDRHCLSICWSAEERRRSRERLWSTTDLGLAAATGLGTSLAASGITAAAAGIGVGVVGGAALPIAAPVAATVLALRLMKKSRNQAIEPASAPTKEQVLADMEQTAEHLSTEDLEALLAAMKAMRESAGTAQGESANTGQ